MQIRRNVPLDEFLFFKSSLEELSYTSTQIDKIIFSCPRENLEQFVNEHRLPQIYYPLLEPDEEKALFRLPFEQDYLDEEGNKFSSIGKRKQLSDSSSEQVTEEQGKADNRTRKKAVRRSRSGFFQPVSQAVAQISNTYTLETQLEEIDNLEKEFLVWLR